ncbi:hypothetical protein HK102_001338 [Quaeritorhiza haematococci]|nr:hypothetical protein HK102_001338 [Quaeritorhiza haematococci]
MIHFLRVAITTVTIVVAMCVPKLAPNVFSKFTTSLSNKYYKPGASVGAVSSVPSYFLARAPAVPEESNAEAAEDKKPDLVALLKELEDAKALEFRVVKEMNEIRKRIRELDAKNSQKDTETGK